MTAPPQGTAPTTGLGGDLDEDLSRTAAEQLVTGLDVVLFHTIEGDLVWVSPSITSVLGYRPEEVVGLAPAAFWHPDDRLGAATLRDDAAEDPSVEHELRVLAKDGTYRRVGLTLRPQTEADGRVGSIGLLRPLPDADDDRPAPTFDAFRLLADHANDLVCLLDLQGHVVWLSQHVSPALGWTRDELMGSVLTDLVHPDDYVTHAEDLRRFYAGAPGSEGRQSGQIRIRTKSGAYRWMTARGTLIRGDDGEPIAVVSGLSDVDELVRVREAAEANSEKLRSTLDALLDPHIVLDTIRDADGAIVDFRFLEANRAASEYLGSDRDVIVGRTILECFPDAIAHGLVERYAPAAEYTGPIVLNDVAIVSTLTGVEGHYDVRATRQGSELTVTWRDVSAQHDALHAVARSEALLGSILDSSPDPTVQFDRDLHISYANRLAEELLQRPGDELIGLGFGDLGFPDAIVEAYELRLREVFRTGKPIVEERKPHDTKYGEAREHRYIPMFDATGAVDHVLVITRDITERRAIEAMLLERATRDPLTGLANRAALADEIDRAIQAGHRTLGSTAVLMADLDNFKHVNDSLGHAAGDSLLITAAERLRHVVRGGEMIARFGGDEFVIVMRNLEDPTDAFRTAQRVVEGFRAPFDIDGVDVYSTASIGIAVATVDSSAEDLIREADTALYVAKGEGRDRIAIFNAELRASVTERLTLEAELRPALDRQELAVWYQPEVDMLTGRVTSVEALLRWNHPERGLLSADKFIDVAEETGLVLDIGAWVLRTACLETAGWNRTHAGPPIVVRVNLSARQIMESNVLTAIDRALEESGLPARFLCVEITETALLRQSPRVLEHVRAVRRRGVQIALDDFGTGYASLSYLREYPVDVLKIDRSFITHVTEDDFDARLVGGLIALADALDVRITAEGVETAEQADLLIALGCERAQGYLYSRAVPADRIDAMLP